ncbi:MAG: hypothetical protein HY420_03010 [Candidatus Kerfeldbacteria bacterium]|nr:hypothetical protein [Candidatus Kerfeldbacteria bacterium]
MALAQKRNTRQSTLLLIVLAAIIIAGIIVYYSLRPKTTTTGPGRSGGSANDLETFTDFGEDLFTEDQFKSLRNFSNTNISTPPSPPIVAPPGDSTGNPDPFRLQ